jgi:fructokinase
MTRQIIGLGEVLYDVLPEGAKLGGAPANFAYHASQFGFDAMAVSAVGNDALGDLALKTFDDNGLKYIIPRVPYPTGTVNISLDAGGVPSYTFTPDVAWDHIPFTPEMEAIAKEARAVCFGSLAQRSEASRKTIHQFLSATPADCLKIFDINLRSNFYNKEIIRENMQKANILKINDEELVTIGRLFDYPGLDMEEKCRLLLRRYHFKMVVLTCGTNGSYVFVPDGETSFMPTPKVEVADTVGAGDSFTAAFTASLLAGKTIKEAHERAVKVSAFVCTQKGAMPKLPEELTK